MKALLRHPRAPLFALLAALLLTVPVHATGLRLAQPVGGSVVTGSTSVLTPVLDTPSAGSLTIGGSNATSVAIGASGVATTNSGNFSVGTKFTVGQSAGVATKVNNESTAGIGQPYVEQVAQDVVSTGASTTIATYTSPATGLYRVTIVVSAHTNSDTVSATVTYTDAVEGFATTLTPISSASLTHDANSGTTSASVVVRASASTNIVATLSTTSQTTTKASAVIERLN